MTANNAGSKITSSTLAEPCWFRPARLPDVAGFAGDICLDRGDDDGDDGDHGHRPEHVLDGDRAALVSTVQPGVQTVEVEAAGHERGEQCGVHSVHGVFLPSMDRLGSNGGQVWENIRSREGATSRAMKIRPRSEPGMVMRSPIALASAISSFNMAVRIAAERARRVAETDAPSSPEMRMMSAKSSSSGRPSSSASVCRASQGGSPDQRDLVSSSESRVKTQESPTSAAASMACRTPEPLLRSNATRST